MCFQSLICSSNRGFVLRFELCLSRAPLSHAASLPPLPPAVRRRLLPAVHVVLRRTLSFFLRFVSLSTGEASLRLVAVGTQNSYFICVCCWSTVWRGKTTMCNLFCVWVTVCLSELLPPRCPIRAIASEQQLSKSHCKMQHVECNIKKNKRKSIATSNHCNLATWNQNLQHPAKILKRYNMYLFTRKIYNINVERCHIKKLEYATSFNLKY